MRACHRFLFACTFPLLLAACGRQEGQAIAASTEQEALPPSPDSTGAVWTIWKNGLGIGFGKDPAEPYLSLACALTSDGRPARLTIIRHARSEPGAKALFAVLGNGVAARFKANAVLAEGEGWYWEAALPAGAGEFEVFTGPRDIEATLPGAGTILLPPSNLPREFVSWCRRNGEDLPEPKALSPSPQA